jgi:ParB-like chromosome segregation protein Spo0J
MVASTTHEQSKAIIEIERLGFGYAEVAQFDLGRLDTTRRIQVRESTHYAPKEAVERYAVQMAHSEFPPVVITADDYIVDGNTRVGAALMRGVKFFPAYVLDVPFKGGSEKQANELHALAATLNAQNGTPLTAKEARLQAEKLVALGWKIEQIGRAIGLKASSVSAVKREIEAAAKLKKVGLDPNGSMRGASLRALGSKDAIGLNDIPFKELARLATDASLNMGEIHSVAKEVKQLGSDTTQVDKITALRTEMGDRIRERELTGSAKPPRARQLRQHLGYVINHEGSESELVETDPKVAGQHLEVLERAIKVLVSVLEMQRPK